MMSKPTASNRYSLTGLCLVSALLLTACEKPTVGVSDYRMQHRVYSQEKVFNLILPMPSSGQFSIGHNRQKMEIFAHDYLRRGHGPILISHNGDGKISQNSQTSISNMLYSAGVPEAKIFFQARAQTENVPQSLELSYSGFVVRVPRCGDWSGQTGFDPSNMPHTDFGCSFQRNTGLIIANPGDLSVSSGETQYDAATNDRVIKTYRRGQRLGTDFPTKEVKEFSDVKSE